MPVPERKSHAGRRGGVLADDISILRPREAYLNRAYGGPEIGLCYSDVEG